MSSDKKPFTYDEIISLTKEVANGTPVSKLRRKLDGTPPNKKKRPSAKKNKPKDSLNTKNIRYHANA